VIKVVLVLLVTMVVVAFAVETRHAYVLSVLLGISYGVMLSYPVMKYLGPKIQAGVAGFLGGVTVSNAGSKAASIDSGIIAVSKSVGSLITTLHNAIFQEGAEHAAPGSWTYLDQASFYCVWMTIITTFLIVLVNAISTSAAPSRPSPGPVSAAVPGSPQ